MDRSPEECLNEHLLDRLSEARRIIETWRIDYNTVRPHTSPGGLAPAVFADNTRRARRTGVCEEHDRLIGQRCPPETSLYAGGTGAVRLSGVLHQPEPRIKAPV